MRDASSVQVWRKSSYSGGGNGDCLEVADGYADVPVRDSKNPHGPALIFPADGWSSFIAAVQDGRLSS
ncbi:DUF397 domain-containing protein [Streptomyces sp. NPDC051320]|uniref:DUF397 domain-containing protein n=1 Tax=Streptomyces sp. NPDC051320 TaxID=3154644 RepID=UPI0034215863